MKKILLGCAAMPMAAMPAMAADVTLNASIISSCTLTIGSGGTMTAAASGTLLSSEQSGGSAATLNIVAVGILPTVSFSAPSLITSPSGWSRSPVSEIKYTSTGGANQAYTASASSRVQTGLLDGYTIHGRVTNSGGFAAGNYALRTTVTCTQ